MMRVLTVAAICAMLLAGGCKVDHAKETSFYREQLEIPGAAPGRPWDSTQPLGILEAMLLANDQNERLASEGENYLQATIARKRALALFLPTADLSGTYSRADEMSGGTFDLAALARINVFNGFRDIARLRAADLTIEQRRLALLDLQESLLADVVRVYYRVLRLEKTVDVLVGSLEVQEQRLRDITRRYEAGEARVLEVAQTEAQVASTRVRLLDARVDAADARAALALLLGVDAVDGPLIEETPIAGGFPDVESAQAAALAARRDLAAAEQARLAARQAVEVAVGQYYPSASINLRYFLNRDTPPESRDWDTVLQVNLPVFSAGQIRADVREAWSRYRQANLFRSLLERQIRRDVEVAHRNLLTSATRLEQLEIQMRSAELALTSATATYDAGLATNLERIIAQDQLLNAELQLASEEYNRRVYVSDLARATGGLRAALEQLVQQGDSATDLQPEVNP